MIQPLRVMQIVAAPVDTPGFGVNGPEKRAADIIASWREYGIEPIILYPRRGRLWPAFEKANVPLVDFEIGSKFNFPCVWKIRSIARQLAVSIIHTQGPPSLDAFAGIAARSLGIGHILTRPSMIDQVTAMSPIRKSIYRALDLVTLRLAKRVITVCRRGAEQLSERRQWLAQKCVTVYNGIDMKPFLAEFSIARSEGRPTIGMVGQLKGGKGWDDFLAVVDRLRLEFPDINALIIGDGPLRSVVQEGIKARNLEKNVSWLGHQDDVAPLLRQLDIFLFTSHREGLPMSILEAMAAGLPVVTTDTGGVCEQVSTGINGFVVPVGDIDGLVSGISQLLKDPQLRSKFGEVSRTRTMNNFSQREMIRGYAECYRQVAGM